MAYASPPIIVQNKLERFLTPSNGFSSNEGSESPFFLNDTGDLQNIRGEKEGVDCFLSFLAWRRGDLRKNAEMSGDAVGNDGLGKTAKLSNFEAFRLFVAGEVSEGSTDDDRTGVRISNLRLLSRTCFPSCGLSVISGEL